MKKQLHFWGFSIFLISASCFKITAQSCATVPFAVVELFTSQGCNSCPTGDQLLTNLINQEKNSGRNVICIAEHVTYWDQLGWTDQYGMATFGVRQNSYVYTAGMNVKGTPQLFVNGKTNVTNTGSLNNAVNNYLGAGNVATAGICLSTTSSNTASTIVVNYELTGNYAGANLIICLIENGLSVTPTAGENEGVLLRHDGVARIFNVIPITSATGTVNITPPSNCVRAKSRIVAYIQAPLIGSTPNSTIRGATKGLDLSNAALGLQNNETKATLYVYPNPTNEKLVINYMNAAATNNVTISLTDLSGRMVYIESISNTGIAGEFIKNIDVSALAKGVYLFNLKTENKIINKKIIVE